MFVLLERFLLLVPFRKFWLWTWHRLKRSQLAFISAHRVFPVVGVLCGPFPAVWAGTPVEKFPVQFRFNYKAPVHHNSPALCSKVKRLQHQPTNLWRSTLLLLYFFSYSVSLERTTFKSPLTCSKSMGSRVRVLVIDGSALNLNHSHKPCEGSWELLNCSSC